MRTLSVAAFICAMLLCAQPVMARQGTLPVSRRSQIQPLQNVPQLVVTPTDAQAELAKDANAAKSAPVRFAAMSEVVVTPQTHGRWEAAPGGRVWRLRVVSAGATDLNFGFTTFWLPSGATLHVYAEGEDYVQGPYAARDNKAPGQLWTPVLPGSRAVIELFVPNDAVEHPQLILSKVNRGYRDLFHRQKGDAGTPKAGACNIDVVCPIAAPWSNEVRSVARYSISGIFLCTGSLVNDALGDYRPYFLTAAHCTVSPQNAGTVIAYWNFQSPTCGQHGGGSLAQNQSGAIFRAARVDTDMTLIELEELPDPSFNTYYAGWDHSGATPSGAVGIHHPSAHEKSISFSSNVLTTVDNCIGTGGINTHWNVTWTVGVTEQGSSGSGIWDPISRRIVGTLSGGDSYCNTPFLPDCYGKFSVAWTNGSSSAERLRDWLDPLSSGSTGISGMDAKIVPLIRSGAATLTAESCSPANGKLDPGETVTISVSLQNVGLTNTVDLIATLLETNGVTAPSTAQSYGALTINGPIVTRSFTFTASGSCGSSVEPRILLQDGTNIWGMVSYSFVTGTLNAGSTQSFDTVSSPALPAGWTTAADGLLPEWATTTAASHTAPNSAYGATDDTIEGESVLVSSSISITSAVTQISFAHWYNVETGWDGGVLEVSLNGGDFVDILEAGATFASGGYNGSLSDSFNPLAGRSAWTGNSGDFITTVVNLPPSFAGQSIQLRWHLGNDDSISIDGWYVDTFVVSSGTTCCHSLTPPQIIETQYTNDNVIFSFNTVTGQTYITEFQNTLNTNLAWTPLQTNAGDGTKKSVTNSTAGLTNGFFRIKTQ